MSKEEFAQLLSEVVKSFVAKYEDTQTLYFPINPKNLTILSYSNDKRETMWVSMGWDVWRIYSDEDLTTQVYTIVEHYF